MTLRVLKRKKNPQLRDILYNSHPPNVSLFSEPFRDRIAKKIDYACTFRGRFLGESRKFRRATKSVPPPFDVFRRFIGSLEAAYESPTMHVKLPPPRPTCMRHATHTREHTVHSTPNMTDRSDLTDRCLSPGGILRTLANRTTGSTS